MHSQHHFLTAAVTSLLLTGTALSQSGQTGSQGKLPTADQQGQDKLFRADQWVDIEKLIGADVRLEASDEAKREAAEDGERAEGDNGEVTDVLFNQADGTMQWALVSCGGWMNLGDKVVLLPFDSLTWNAAQSCFFLGLSEEQLKGLPDFDFDEANERGLDGALATYKTTWGQKGLTAKPVEASSRPDAQKPQPLGQQGAVQTYGDHRFSRVANQHVSAKHLDGVDVFAQDTDFADVSTFIVDREANKIAFVVLSHGGIGDLGDTKYIVPLESMGICHMGDVDDESPKTVLFTTKTSGELEGCIKYEAPENGALSQTTLGQLRSKQATDSAAGKQRPVDGSK